MHPGASTIIVYHCFKHILAGGLEHEFYFPIYWESHHPNWLSYFSEGFKPPTSIALRLYGIFRTSGCPDLVQTRPDEFSLQSPAYQLGLPRRPGFRGVLCWFSQGVIWKILTAIGRFPRMGVPKNNWIIIGKTHCRKDENWGVPLFSETSSKHLKSIRWTRVWGAPQSTPRGRGRSSIVIAGWFICWKIPSRNGWWFRGTPMTQETSIYGLTWYSSSILGSWNWALERQLFARRSTGRIAHGIWKLNTVWPKSFGAVLAETKDPRRTRSKQFESVSDISYL